MAMQCSGELEVSAVLCFCSKGSLSRGSRCLLFSGLTLLLLNNGSELGTQKRTVLCRHHKVANVAQLAFVLLFICNRCSDCLGTWLGKTSSFLVPALTRLNTDVNF